MTIRNESVDVVVVGAGLAGLVAARNLTRAGRTVRVVEARDRVGGRVLNHVLDDGQTVESGGQFVGPTQNHILRLAASVGVQTFPSYADGKTVYVRGTRSKRFDGEIPPDLTALPDLAMQLARISRATKRISLGAPWTGPRAAALDAVSFDSWLRRTAIGDGGVDLVNTLLGSVYGATAGEASALFSLAYIAGAGDETNPGTLDRLMAVGGGAQESRFVGGSHLIATRLAEQLGEELVLSSPVRRIEQTEATVTVISDRGSFTAAHVIITVPPHLAVGIDWDPLLPPQQEALFRRMAFGTLMKCEAVYDRPFWRDEGLSGMAVFRGTDSAVCSMFDNTPPSGGPGVLMGFVGSAGWRRWGPRSMRERGGAVLQSFARALGPRALAPIEYFEHDWTAEEWTRGGPTSVLAPGVLGSLGSWRDAAFGRVHWAGAEHADYWTGFMDGAVRSGEDAATAVMAVEEAAA